MDLFHQHHDLDALAERMEELINRNESPVLVCDPSLIPAIELARKAFVRNTEHYNPPMVASPSWTVQRETYADYIIARVLEYRIWPNTGIRSGRDNDIWQRMEKLNGPEIAIRNVEYFSGGIPEMISLLFKSPSSFQEVVGGISDIFDKPPFNQMWFVFDLKSEPEPVPVVESGQPEVPSNEPFEEVPEVVEVSELHEATDEAISDQPIADHMVISPVDGLEDQEMKDQEMDDDNMVVDADDNYVMSGTESADEMEIPKQPQLEESEFSSDDESANIPTPSSINDDNVGSDPEGVFNEDSSQNERHLGAYPTIFFYYFRFLMSQPLIEIGTLDEYHATQVKTALSHLHRFCTTLRLTFKHRGMSDEIRDWVRHYLSFEINPVDTGELRRLVYELSKRAIPKTASYEEKERLRESVTRETWMYIIQEWIIAAQLIIESVDKQLAAALEKTTRQQMDARVEELAKSVEKMYDPQSWPSSPQQPQF